MEGKGKLLEILRSIEQRSEKKEPRWQEKLKAAGVADSEFCVVDSSFGLCTTEKSDELIGRMRHLADKHDVLEAARAYYAVVQLLYSANQQLQMVDRTYGTHIAAQSADGPDDRLKDAKDLLAKVEAKHELLKSLSH